MSEDNSRNHDSSATHTRLQHSTTLNRRYVQRPEPMRLTEEVEAARQGRTEEIEVVMPCERQDDIEVAIQQEQVGDATGAEQEMAEDAMETEQEVAEVTAEAAQGAAEVALDAEQEMVGAAEAVKISSFAKCQAENLRRRQELADKINHERALAMQQNLSQRGYVAAEAQQDSAKRIKVMAVTDEEPEEEWETEEVERAGEAEWITPEPKHADETEWTIPEVKHVDERKWGMVQELPMQRAANERLARTWNEPATMQQPTARELKDAAIRKAMHSVATMEATERKEETKKLHRRERRHMRVRNRKRIALAISCAVAVVGVISCFVMTNLPSVSYGTMAMQSGIDLSGLWTPRDFSLVTSSAGDGSLSVTYAKGDEHFVLSADTTTWDSQALLNNFVTVNWRSYDTVKEQGKTIYISGSNAAWVSGGIRYILEAEAGVLTNKQIKTIAASL